MIIERKQCPVCDSSSLNTLFSIERNNKSFLSFLKLERFYGKRFWEGYHDGMLNGLVYKIVKCNGCGFIFQYEVLNETGMKLLYNDWLDQELLLQYYSEKKPVKHTKNMLKILGKALKNQTSLQILDYGAGYGGFCALSLKYGFNTFAYELSNNKDKYLSSEMGIITINSLDNYQSFFDFIYLNQVLEHVSKPRELLMTLSGSLRDNGIIFVSVPDCKYVTLTINRYGLSKELFLQLSPFQHINAFNNKTLKKIGKLSGLQAFDLIEYSKLIKKEFLTSGMIFLFKNSIKSFYGTSLFFKKLNTQKRVVIPFVPKKDSISFWQ